MVKARRVSLEILLRLAKGVQDCMQGWCYAPIRESFASLHMRPFCGSLSHSSNYSNMPKPFTCEAIWPWKAEQEGSIKDLSRLRMPDFRNNLQASGTEKLALERSVHVCWVAYRSSCFRQRLLRGQYALQDLICMLSSPYDDLVLHLTV